MTRCPRCHCEWEPISKFQPCPACGMLGNRNNPDPPPSPGSCTCAVTRCRWTGDRRSNPGEPGRWNIVQVTVCDFHQKALDQALEELAREMREVCTP